jgi:hypothetical protein
MTDQIFYTRHKLKKTWKFILPFSLVSDGRVHEVFIVFKKANDSVRKDVLYNILVEYGIPRELVRLIKMCLNETYSIVRTGTACLGKSRIQNGPERGRCFITVAFKLYFGIRRKESPREVGRAEIEWDTPAFGLC